MSMIDIETIIKFSLLFITGGLTLSFASVTGNYCSTKKKSALLGFAMGVGVVSLGMVIIALLHMND